MATLYYESSFAHHGVKGQKWYVRRYQNPDGTLTKAGRRHLQRNFKKQGTAYTDEISEFNNRSIKDSLNSKKALLDAYDQAVDAADNLEKIEKTLSPIRDDKKLRRRYAEELAERFDISAMDHHPTDKERESIINNWMNGEKSSELELHYANSIFQNPKHPNVTLYDMHIKYFGQLNDAAKSVSKELLKENGFKKIDELSNNYKFDYDTYSGVNDYLRERLFSDEYLKKIKNHNLIGN